MRITLESNVLSKTKYNKTLIDNELENQKNYPDIYLGNFYYFNYLTHLDKSLPSAECWRVKYPSIFRSVSEVLFQDILKFFPKKDHARCLYIHNYLIQKSKKIEDKIYKL